MALDSSMTPSTENLQGQGRPEILAQYAPRPGAYDEMLDSDGRPRPAWETFLRGLEDLGPQGIAQHFEQTRRLLRDSGVRFPSFGPSRGSEEHWELDPIPWLLAKGQWSGIAAGVAQRAKLLNAIQADLYGPQELLQRGLLPPALVFGHAGFLLPCHGVPSPKGNYLHLYAGQLARMADGQWMVLADRTQGPAGAGLAVENRIVLSRVLPTHFHNLHVERLASFFLALRQTLQILAPQHRDNPRIVLLSPGPKSSRYFEDTYLARYLGYILVEGGDLTVRGSTVCLKTLGGLLPVDVILRRQPDEDCDPLELKATSHQGVPGLVQAVRSAQVLVANALGSGYLESPALMAFLPEICRYLLGEELRLPSMPTWWCGRPSDWQHVQAGFDDLVIVPAVRRRGQQPILTAELTRRDRDELLETIRDQPAQYVAHARVLPSTAPAWSEGSLQPCHVALRAFAVAAGDEGYQVMPGGLSRVLPNGNLPGAWTAAGQANKDVWILSDRPVAPVSLLRWEGPAVELRRSGNDLPSRVADNLYWLGRHLERAEGMVRLLRSCLVRITSELEPQDLCELALLVQSLSDNSLLLQTGRADPAGLQQRLQAEVISFLFDESRSNDFYETLRAAYEIASVVRDRLSVDTWRMVNQLDIDLLFPRNKDHLRPGDLLLALNQTLNLLVGLSGLGMESMTRGPGWRFLDMGRRLERAQHTLRLLRKTLVQTPVELAPLLEVILEIADSSMTYRYRYLTSLQLAPALDLLLTDESNPRSVGFQLSALSDHVRELPNKGVDPLRNPETRLVLAVQTSLRLVDVEGLAVADSQGLRRDLQNFLDQMMTQLRQLSGSITHAYLTHTRPSRQLGSVCREP
jgi:uncharacterized circularly permuted ATP-grasp superfamily protein/uncharacterized alpha-E superfamily protein